MSQPAATISAVMQANAEQAVKYAHDRFRSELDYSAHSLERVDKIIDVMHIDLPKSFVARAIKGAAVEEEIWTTAKMWGAYVGETIRRKWGGRWRTTPSPEGHAEIVLELPTGKCKPVAEVRRRLAEGTGPGAFAMYAALLKISGEATAPAHPDGG